MHELRVDALDYRHQGADDDTVHGFSATFPSGRATWLEGRNGIGKTTLLELVAGLRRPARGSITLDGDELERSRVLLLPSDPPVFPELDAEEHAALVCELWELDAARRAAFRPRFADALAELAMPSARALIGTYSTGMRQKLALALGLALAPDVLLLDEPLTATDATSQDASRRLLEAHARDHVLVLTSHIPAIVEPLHPRVVHMEQGARR
ncbi:ABC transporter ATP-binding protein [Clavibacter sp. Sh2088]|uniref:ABC transporter ATP-binding protein n=1 Tax=Clavibacter sp. Sh2088 TaxID=3397676 RepID=UPI0039E17735